MRDLEYVRTDRNRTKIYYDWNCPHCGGVGRSDNWKFTGSTCWECGGTGLRRKPLIVKYYTPEHEAKLAEKAKARFEKKRAEENATFLKRTGFADDGTGYIFTGDTRPYKEELKAGGARWNNWTHWIAPTPIGDYPYIKVQAAALCHFGESYNLDMEKCFAWVDEHKPW